ncbi:hypothetical protein A9995_00725 [Erythrobacter sp. QSSC1-22B]|uniref:hypothetical protein n=1 Tax=Erythrobacter sp. QSSC1-22B TaxID=1860125 RepID=UPI000805B06E|nr:hypothetical protein [Erythrobacter sp. QSSC1-22B]OBX20290.1 hypothetical protein A9995_00725 [Erythrobacter sp. QSSC1-22B]
MNAQTAIKPDEITTFLGSIPAEEFEKRSKLRSLRNAAAAMIASTESDTARALAWFATEYATQALYSPGATQALDDLNKLCTRFMLTAIQAEQIDLERFGE